VSQVEIAPYAEQHAFGVIELILPIQRQEFGVPVTLREQPDLLDIARFYRKGNGNFWVALSDGKVVGTIALLDIGNGEGALRKMFVDASYRGPQHGVGRRLLETLLQWCGSRGLRGIYLGTTDAFRAAHRFYEKNGFSEIARAQLPPAFPVMAVDSKYYRLALRTPQR
jgi:N-acetylglutamate synthase-like GNAT family acetyltransferase